MNKAGSKILGTFFFIVLISILFYLIFLPKKIINRTVNKIEFSGNKFLAENDYLKQTKLSGIKNYNDLKLTVIKDRLEKHPYILRADVEIKSKEVAVFITEKKMIAIILKGTKLNFVSDNLEVIPLLPNTKFIDLPVISNPGNKELKPFSFMKDEDLISAIKIIESTKMIDKTMLSHLSEINLRNGGDIVLTFSGYSAPVILGRGEEARKIFYLKSLWDEQSVSSRISNMLKDISYIDLRFAGNIYTGPITAGQNIGIVE